MHTVKTENQLDDTHREELFTAVNLSKLEEKLLQITKNLTDTNLSAINLEKKISDIQIQLENFNQNVNGNAFRSENNRQRVQSEIPEHCSEVSFNVQERIKRKTRIVLFNVPYNDEDKEQTFIEGFTDLYLVVDLMYHSGLNFQPKYCFRVLSGKKCRYPKTSLKGTVRK